MSRPTEIAKTYRLAVDRLEACCSRVEGLHAKGKIAITEVELIYESAFVNGISRFEGLLNELLEEFVCGNHMAAHGCKPNVHVHSRTVYRNLLSAGKEYVELLPFSRCVTTAERFLRDGRPFADVREDDKRLLGQALLIRNAIAHRSQVAMTKFRAKVPGVEVLPANRKLPGTLLRRDYRAHPVQSWNLLYLGTLKKIGVNLAEGW